MSPHRAADPTASHDVVGPDEPLAVVAADARIDPERWGPLPRTYVRWGADRSIPPAQQDRVIAEARAEALAGWLPQA